MTKKRCRWCDRNFEIQARDIEFYKMVAPQIGDKVLSIPSPSLCPQCRQQRRLCFRNEKTFYRDTCAASGESILSMYPPDSGYKVFSRDVYFSDSWEPRDYGRDFDFSRGFFEQFKELSKDVPQLALFHQRENENCEYANLTSDNKDSYFIFAASKNEQCYYSNYLHSCYQVSDCFFIFRSELCYECIDCYDCFGVQHSQQVENCRDSSFLYDCRGCKDCFGCVSLVNKRFHFFNKPLSELQYREAVAKLRTSRSHEEICATFELLKQSIPKKYYAGINNQNSTGDHISYCKNTFSSFDCTELEDCSYCTWLHKSVNCQDCYAWGSSGELGYENHLCGNGFYRVLFSDSCANNNSDLLYCRSCNNGNKHLFGCIGIQRGQYCILNKQYSPQDYRELVVKIVRHMAKRGEWGEFFDPVISPFNYNQSTAQEYFPVEQEEATRRGWRWNSRIHLPKGKQTLGNSDKLIEINEQLLDEVLSCIACERNYKIVSAEATFLKKNSLPIPKLCFHCRYEARRTKRNSRELIEGKCENCEVTFQTSFSSTADSKVICEECWNEMRY